MGCTMSMNVLPEHARRFAAQHLLDGQERLVWHTFI
jgi:hypothetical protein